VEPKRIDIHIDAERISHLDSGEEGTLVGIKFLGYERLDSVQEVGYSSDSIEAKYLALIKTLELFREMSSEMGEVEKVVIHSDCWMMVDQYTGKTEVKEAKLVKMLRVVKDVQGELKAEVRLRYIPRKENLAREILGTEKGFEH
jgi:hypothetical protein